MLFEEIYENYYKDVYRFCLSLTKADDSAEDLAQETFVKALAAIDSFDGSKDVKQIAFLVNVWLTFNQKDTKNSKNICSDNCLKRNKLGALRLRVNSCKKRGNPFVISRSWVRVPQMAPG